MAGITEDVIRRLAGFKGGDASVVSLYLDVDGRRYVRQKDYELQLDALLRQAAERGNGAGVSDDLHRIESYVKGRLDRSRTRGLAIFSCGAKGLWEVIELPVPVRNQLVVNRAPQVRQLENVVDEYEPFGVLLADRQRARMFVFELGQLVDKSERFDLLPRHEDDQGDRRKDQMAQHVDEAAHRHLKHAAKVAFEVFREHPFQHLLIAAPEEIAKELERSLHPYLRDRVADRLSIGVGARDDDIRHAALEAEERVERRKEAELVTRLRDAVGAGAGAVAGLEAVLRALVERRVDLLIVSDGYEAPGWHCGQCGFLAGKGPRCPVCTGRMSPSDDVVEDAVEEALNQSCRVEICVENADLDVLGRIGALLRY